MYGTPSEFRLYINKASNLSIKAEMMHVHSRFSPAAHAAYHEGSSCEEILCLSHSQLMHLLPRASSELQCSVYNVVSIGGAGAGMCPATQDLRESIKQNIRSLINSSVLSALTTQNQTQIGPGYAACGCGGYGWKKAAYLNITDPMQTCPPAWELITTPRRSCGRPSDAERLSCYSAMFPTQGIQYSQVCGRIIGYQVGEPQAFHLENRNRPQSINGAYVDGVSLTFGNPRQHIWTFTASLDETGTYDTDSRCSCTNPSYTNIVPSFVGSSYFCETGVP